MAHELGRKKLWALLQFCEEAIISPILQMKKNWLEQGLECSQR